MLYNSSYFDTPKIKSHLIITYIKPDYWNIYILAATPLEAFRVTWGGVSWIQNPIFFKGGGLIGLAVSKKPLVQTDRQTNILLL